MSAHIEHTSQPAETATAIAARARAVFDDNHAIQLATLGGEWSPWILGAYFTRAPEHLRARGAHLPDLDLVLMIERSGKSLANLKIDPRVAFTVSKNDAAQDFAQGNGHALLLPESDADAVVEALVHKLPGYRLYTPCVPVRVELHTLFVTSFAAGWLPARRLTLR